MPLCASTRTGRAPLHPNDRMRGLITRAALRLACVWACACATLVVAAEAAAPIALPAAGASAPLARAARPRVGLVLSGGGARGLAHVGALKVLEQARIPIDAIAGTSMGAIVGGLYASGMRADALERELNAVHWDQVFSNRIDRPELSQRRK